MDYYSSLQKYKKAQKLKEKYSKKVEPQGLIPKRKQEEEKPSPTSALDRWFKLINEAGVE